MLEQLFGRSLGTHTVPASKLHPPRTAQRVWIESPYFYFLETSEFIFPRCPLIHSYIAWKNLKRIHSSPAVQVHSTKRCTRDDLETSRNGSLQPEPLRRGSISCAGAHTEPWSGLWKAGYGWHPLSSSAKLPDSLRKDGSKEQNKTLTCMTE